ncbi:cell envelope protein SmpA [Pseudomonas sp. Irchel s3b2]|uniref:cell envelope protein SmpA n=1 Tax=Pseudomonas sp. Irchel s3b2 TaxID=2009073 RepID=UPI000BA4DC30|nr:cell envelope protein SmpA [Pseudomonas sp. Irchel s3b2]
MPSNAHYYLLATLLCQLPQALATTVHRCEAANGHITFTTLSCTAGESLSLQDVRTFLPGSATPLMPEAEFRDTSGTKIQRRRAPTIVGQSEDKCGNLLSAKERRIAIINQRVVAGMSQQDVESALGKPDKISTRNSATSYRYDNKRGRSAHIEFDEKGCTKGKAKSQTAKSPR